VLEGRDRFLKSGVCYRVFALCRGHDRLGTLDAARDSEPVLARGDDLAATLKVRQRLEGVASVRS